MPKVVNLMEYRNRDSIAVLRYLTRLALRGELAGLALCYRHRRGNDEYAFTGVFMVDAASALKAANRISWKMNQALDAQEGGPP